MTPPHRRSLSGLAAVVLIWLAVPATATSQATPLRWSFRKGDTFRYALTQDSTTKTNFQGNAIENRNDQVFDVTWKVAAVRPDGSAELIQTFDRIRFRAEGLFGAIHFDTQGKEEAPPAVEAQARVFRSLIGAEITLVMTPEGDVKDIKLPARTVEALNDVTAPPGAPKPLGEDSIKNIVELSTQPLPGKAVEPGATWTRTRRTASPLGTMTVATTYTLAGADAAKGAERIDVASTVDLKVKPDLPLKATIKSQDVHGTAYFDAGAGRLISSTVDQKVELNLDTMGNSLVQETVTKLAITLKTDDQGKE